MNPRNHKSTDTKTFKGMLLSALFVALAVVSTPSTVLAAEPPDAPSSSMAREGDAMIEMVAPTPSIAQKKAEVRIMDSKFVALAIISSGSTFADSYTTLFARQNWLAGKTGVCNAEVSSAYLYGTHPTVGRTYAVASVKSAGSIVAAYYLRKHHSKFWSLPLITNSVTSLGGVSQNMKVCN